MKLAPADRLLELLLKSGRDYRCRPQPGRWVASCPLCGVFDLGDPERFSLVITEHGRGGRVSVQCRNGCDGDEVLQRLVDPGRCWQCGGVHGQAAELERVVSDLLELAHTQQRLIRQLVPESDRLAVAA